MDKITVEQAVQEGFTVDRTCYPWYAYKGPRFAPTAGRLCFTDTETEMIEALKSEYMVMRRRGLQNLKIEALLARHGIDVNSGDKDGVRYSPVPGEANQR